MTAAALADPRSKYVPGYVPAGWPDSQVVRQFDGKNITAKSAFTFSRSCIAIAQRVISRSRQGNNVTQIDTK